MNEKPVSKVLVLDNSQDHAQRIKEFCEQNDLVPLKVRKDSVMSVLKTNIDLGAILYSENYGETPAETARIATEIHALRPELPIIIRRQKQATLAGLPDELQHVCCRAYVASDFPSLRKVIDEYIFCLIYPNALLRGISEITESVLKGQFAAQSVSFDTPYIVHDRVIFGEVFSLIQLESSWCRGYMMLQTEEDAFLDLAGAVATNDAAAMFRKVNDRLSEVTNLIWGSFKNRYIGDEKMMAAARVQVPLVVNHKHKYISFGTENPQLCFRFTLTDAKDGRTSTLYARFIFNLNWSPEDFKEIVPDVDGLVDSGELELF
ncbi:MAG TPA: chemotaxis protein CheX [Vicinamibacterales bacterium]|nr:chemotaxis protein CheX [Vicinamibacterales bacterium]